MHTIGQKKRDVLPQFGRNKNLYSRKLAHQVTDEVVTASFV